MLNIMVLGPMVPALSPAPIRPHNYYSIELAN